MGGYGATPHRHEARRRVRQPLHHEPVLPVAARRRRSGAPRPNPAQRRGAGGGQDRRRIRRSCPSACAPSWPRRRRGRRTRRTRRSTSICRSATSEQAVLAKWAANAPLAFIDQYIPGCAAIAPSRSTSAIRTGCASTPAKLHDALDRYGIANTLRDLLRDAHERRRRPLPGARDAVLQPDAVVRAAETVNVFRCRGHRACWSAAPPREPDAFPPGLPDPAVRIAPGMTYLRDSHTRC